MITHDVDEAVLLSDRIVMMTNGPAASIGEILSVDLPRPRERLKMANDPRYNYFRAEILKFLYERQKNPQAQAATPPAAEVDDAKPDSKKDEAA